MLMILEVILTIVAWRRGWKSKSLIPGVFGFSIGCVLGLCGILPTTFPGILMGLELLIIGVLGFMCYKGN